MGTGWGRRRCSGGSGAPSSFGKGCDSDEEDEEEEEKYLGRWWRGEEREEAEAGLERQWRRAWERRSFSEAMGYGGTPAYVATAGMHFSWDFGSCRRGQGFRRNRAGVFVFVGEDDFPHF